MDECTKVVVTFPSGLLEEIDEVLACDGLDRSEFVREAVRFYLKRRAQAEIRSELKQGYLRMSQVNLQLATEADAEDENMLEDYERSLAESEEIGN